MPDAVVVGRVNSGKSLMVVNLAAFLGQTRVWWSVATTDGATPPARAAVDHVRRRWVSAGAHRTLDVQSITVPIRAGRRTASVRLWDTPGIVDGIPERPEVRRAIASALAQLQHADLVLHVVDASDQEVWAETDRELKGLATVRLPYAVLANKMDRRGAREGLARLKRELKPDGLEVLAVSAVTGQGFAALSRMLSRRLGAD
jgi:50S ribosomal subunit-associated GTPase HflX